jgi:hypothetical protein
LLWVALKMAATWLSKRLLKQPTLRAKCDGMRHPIVWLGGGLAASQAKLRRSRPHSFSALSLLQFENRTGDAVRWRQVRYACAGSGQSTLGFETATAFLPLCLASYMAWSAFEMTTSRLSSTQCCRQRRCSP